MKSKLHYFFCGLAMGAADVVPGVSGGTIAFIIGIYPRLLDAIEAFNLGFFKRIMRFQVREAAALIPWGFILPLLAGIATSIFSLAKAVTYTLATWPIIIWSFFFGLMITSILHLGKELELKVPATWAALAVGAVAGWLISGASNVDIGQSLPIYFVSAFIAICAMILPGISGAFILVLLGQYTHVIHAVATLNFPVLIVFAAGCACGLMTFARVLNRLLKIWPKAIMAVLMGLMIGSLRTIWPWKTAGALTLPPAFDGEFFIALGCAVLGLALPFFLSMAAKRK